MTQLTEAPGKWDSAIQKNFEKATGGRVAIGHSSEWRPNTPQGQLIVSGNKTLRLPLGGRIGQTVELSHVYSSSDAERLADGEIGLVVPLSARLGVDQGRRSWSMETYLEGSRSGVNNALFLFFTREHYPLSPAGCDQLIEDARVIVNEKGVVQKVFANAEVLKTSSTWRTEYLDELPNFELEMKDFQPHRLALKKEVPSVHTPTAVKTMAQELGLPESFEVGTPFNFTPNDSAYSLHEALSRTFLEAFTAINPS